MKLRPEHLKKIYERVADEMPLQYRFQFALWTIDLVRWLVARAEEVQRSDESCLRQPT